MWSPTTQAGADVMKRIAAPMIGGVITSAILELLIYPVIFVIWRRRHLKPENRVEYREIPAASWPDRRPLVRFFLTATIIGAVTWGGLESWTKFRPAQIPDKPFATQTVNGITAHLFTPTGQVRNAGNELTIEFQNASGELVDAGQVKLELDMNMPGMVMHSGGVAERGKTPGSYHIQITPGMAGDWSARLSFAGPAGKGESIIPVNVKP
jgi:YtkA-like protein